MSLRQSKLWPGLGVALLVASPSMGQAPTRLNPVLIPIQDSRPKLPDVSEWSRDVLSMANAVWLESNTEQRARKLSQWVEQTPAQLARVTRILQQSDEAQTAKTITTLKELFAILKRVSWQPGDVSQVQRIVASWTSMGPQLVKVINAKEVSAAQRRNLEQALVDLVTLGRDTQLGTPLARQTWQTQVPLLMPLLKQAKTSIKLVALSVLEAIGPDAAAAGPSVQQSLCDTDRFVRCQAAHTLQSCGMDAAALQAMTAMKTDSDPLVRQSVEAALASTPAPTMAAIENKPTAPAMPITTKQPLPPLNLNLEVAAPAPVKKQTEAIHMPVQKSKEPATLPDTLPNITTVPAVLPSAEPVLPAKKPVSSSQAVPMFGPAPTAQKVVPVSGQTPAQLTPDVLTSRRETKTEVMVKASSLWIPRLQAGTVEEQLMALRELGKLGAGAADAVPALSERLIKGDVCVRREIPKTLEKIGRPARLATAVLERALQDEDTDVKVNAARALLELADK